MKTILNSALMLLLLGAGAACEDGTTANPDTGAAPDSSALDASVEAGADAGSADARAPDQAAGDAGACDPASLLSEALTTGTKILKGVSLPSSTPIADIVKSASQYEGKILRIEGTIVTICQTAGCYVALDDGKGNQLNLKVTDGTVDFRLYTKLGLYAVGEGVFGATGEHGGQVFIQNHGAMIGNIICP